MSHEQPLPAGRELNAMVAEKVMGWPIRTGPDDHRQLEHWCYWNAHPSVVCLWHHWVTGFDGERGPSGHMQMFHPSEDIAAAWLVVEKMRERGYFVAFSSLRDGTFHVGFVSDGPVMADYGDTAQAAICRAALLAVGVTGEP